MRVGEKRKGRGGGGSGDRGGGKNRKKKKPSLHKALVTSREEMCTLQWGIWDMPFNPEVNIGVVHKGNGHMVTPSVGQWKEHTALL